MFFRNGEALGSVLHSAVPDAPAPKRKPGRPKKEETVEEPPVVEEAPVVEDVKPPVFDPSKFMSTKKDDA